MNDKQQREIAQQVQALALRRQQEWANEIAEQAVQAIITLEHTLDPEHRALLMRIIRDIAPSFALELRELRKIALKGSTRASKPLPG